MKANCERILNNTIRYNEIMSAVLPAGLTEDQVYDRLLTRTFEAREIMSDNVDLISKEFTPYFDNPELIDDDMAKDFEEFALKLYQLTNIVDIGFAVQIHDALYRRAKALNDVNGIVKHLYWCGLIYMQWTKGFINLSFDCFNEAYSYKDKYFTEMDKEGRTYFNRCLGNRYVITSKSRSIKEKDIKDVETEFHIHIDEAKAFWTDPKVRELDPDLPWEGYISNIDSNVIAWLDQLRDDNEDDEELLRRFTESVDRLFGGKDNVKHANSEALAKYIILSKEYYNNEISLDTLIEELQELVYIVDEYEFSDDAVAKIFHISAVYQFYLDKHEGLEKERVDTETEDLFNRSFRYYQYHHEANKRKQINQRFIEVVKHYISHERYGQHVFDYLLKATSFSHLPTYAHSVMVGELMVIMTDYFLENHPEALIGLPGMKNVGDVLRNRSGLLDLVMRAGYAHDAGKIDYVDTVAICSRKISDKEFEIIKNHTVFGTELFEYSFNECICDVILGHHRFYNGQGGYPNIFDNTKSRYKFIIDMCGIADVFDAGTDEIGRSYAKGKTVEELVGEIQADAGIKYSPLIAKVLDDPVLIDAIKEHITSGRKSIYYRAYLDLLEE